MHPATMQAVAAQRGSDLHADAAAARRAGHARRSPLAEQHGQFSTRESAEAALSASFCQTIGVISNADAAATNTPGRSPLRGPRRWSVTRLSAYRDAARASAEP